MKRITKKELKEILDKHQKWMLNEDEGERADFSYMNLAGVDLRRENLGGMILQGADLRGADLTGTTLVETDLKGTDLKDTDLKGADLRGADLRGADLKGATLVETDLKGANLDYSCLPLWCGSLYAHFDDRQLKQIAYHIVKAGLQSKNASPETKRELAKLIDFANGFHRVDECGIITWKEEP